MRIVVDSNILFSFFCKDSTFSELCERKELQLISSEYALEEIKIIKKK